MEQRIDCLRLIFLLIFFSYATSFLPHCEARKSLRHLRGPQLQVKALKKHLVTYYSTSDPNSNNYLGSPYYLPPFQDVMGPSSSPQENPPYCIYPPLNPLPPSTTIPSPFLPIQTPPPPPTLPSPFLPIQTPPPPPTSIFPTPPTLFPPSPSIFTPNPPEFPTPSPPGFGPSPPSFEPSPPGLEPSPPSFEPSPPGLEPSPPSFVPSPPEYVPSPPSFVPSPPEYVPSPPEFAPGPPIFLPPIIYPPPTVPPPPKRGTGPALWCVAKPTVPDPIIQEAMNYACGSGADCDAIQPNGSCYQPNTLLAHASFAFNSYWQRTKVAGGACDFGGTAMLITKDPSYDGCRFSIS